MENITGKPVTHKDYLKTRLFLVKDLKHLLKKCSVIVEAPRRFGKTSVIKELIRQENAKQDEKREFNILYLELEGEETINAFCIRLFSELLVLYRFRKRFNDIGKSLGDFWNIFASRFKKIGLPGIELELKEKTRAYDLAMWKEKIEPLIRGLDSFYQKTVIVFDEFPDMLLNFKKEDESSFKEAINSLTAWLRSLRQIQGDESKYRFVFCGSIHLRKTLEEIGLSKRINDLETFPIPSINEDDAQALIDCLVKTYNLRVEPDARAFMILKVTNGSLYFGQILVKALRDTNEKNFSTDRVKAIYKTLLREGDHDLAHYHSRLEDYLINPGEKECADIILKHLCAGANQEQDIYESVLVETCTYEQFQSVVNRLIYEGYITRDTKDNGKIRFVAPLLQDWWAFKKGIGSVRI